MIEAYGLARHTSLLFLNGGSYSQHAIFAPQKNKPWEFKLALKKMLNINSSKVIFCQGMSGSVIFHFAHIPQQNNQAHIQQLGPGTHAWD